MTHQDLPDDSSLSGALQRVADGSQNVLLAHISALRLEVKEDVRSALCSILLIGEGVILLNGAWFSLAAFALHGLDGQLSSFANLAIVGGVSALIGAGLVLVGLLRLRAPRVEPDAAPMVRADSAL